MHIYSTIESLDGCPLPASIPHRGHIYFRLSISSLRIWILHKKKYSMHTQRTKEGQEPSTSGTSCSSHCFPLAHLSAPTFAHTCTSFKNKGDAFMKAFPICLVPPIDSQNRQPSGSVSWRFLGLFNFSSSRTFWRKIAQARVGGYRACILERIAKEYFILYVGSLH